MKRTFYLILSVMLASMLAGCGGNTGQPPQPTEQAEQTAEASPSAVKTPAYEFSFGDTSGIVHKLSDYKGKPVYLEIWGTWCSVCMSSLPDLDRFAGEDHDFTVLSVVFPDVAGEMSKDDFIEWFNGQNYKNLTVLLDDKAQIIGDFGITAFPSIIVFDSGGVPVTGFAGLMPQESIEEIMKQVAEGTYER